MALEFVNTINTTGADVLGAGGPGEDRHAMRPMSAAKESLPLDDTLTDSDPAPGAAK